MLISQTEADKQTETQKMNRHKQRQTKTEWQKNEEDRGAKPNNDRQTASIRKVIRLNNWLRPYNPPDDQTVMAAEGPMAHHWSVAVFYHLRAH